MALRSIQHNTVDSDTLSANSVEIQDIFLKDKTSKGYWVQGQLYI